jgi:hypothetical protein
MSAITLSLSSGFHSFSIDLTFLELRRPARSDLQINFAESARKRPGGSIADPVAVNFDQPVNQIGCGSAENLPGGVGFFRSKEALFDWNVQFVRKSKRRAARDRIQNGMAYRPGNESSLLRHHTGRRGRSLSDVSILDHKRFADPGSNSGLLAQDLRE